MRASARLLVFVLLLVGVGLRFYHLGEPDLVGGDEGYYGTYARNLLAGGLDQLLNLGREPLSSPDNKPFLFPLLIAAPVAVLGPTERAARAVPAFAGLLCAVLVGAIVRRRYGEGAAWAAAAATLLLPPLVYASRVVMGEGVLAAFGLAGIWAAYVALEERRAGWAWAAGAFWGCGFLVKLWLVGLFIAPVGLALLCHPGLRAEAGSWGRLVRAGVAFVIVGGVHLALVAWLSPATLHHWVEQYFIFSLFGRAGGQQFADYWHQPWSFYLRATLQSAFMALPLAAVALGRDENDLDGARRALPQRVLWGGLAAELVLISCMGVKLRQYSFPLLPSLAALAGIGAAAVFERSARLRTGWVAALAGAPLGLLTWWQASAEPLFPSRTLAFGAAAFLGASMVAVWIAAARPGMRDLAGTAAAAAAIVVAVAGSALTVQRECLAHRTGYREAAAAIAPLLSGRAPTDAAFFATEVPSLQYYLFRTGRYWTTPYEPRSEAELLQAIQEPRWVAFVTSERADLYGGPTPPGVTAWLAANTRELTAEVTRAAGTNLPIRVFVRSAESVR